MINAVSINVGNEKDLNMSMKFKNADGQVFYLSLKINCSKFRTEVKDGFAEKVRCIALKPKTKCKTCSLSKWK